VQRGRSVITTLAPTRSRVIGSSSGCALGTHVPVLRFGDGKSITTAVKANILNRGGPKPRPFRGYFTVRHATDGTTFAR
jgi:hypothetical protein